MNRHGDRHRLARTRSLPTNAAGLFGVVVPLSAVRVVVLGGAGLTCTSSSVTGETETKLLRNILAGSSVTFTGATSSLAGRAMAQTAVTMPGTTISGCGGSGGRSRR